MFQIASASWRYSSESNPEAFLSALKGNAPLTRVAGASWLKPCTLTKSPGMPPEVSLLKKSGACSGTSSASSPASLRSNCTTSAIAWLVANPAL